MQEPFFPTVSFFYYFIHMWMFWWSPIFLFSRNVVKIFTMIELKLCTASFFVKCIIYKWWWPTYIFELLIICKWNDQNWIEVLEFCRVAITSLCLTESLSILDTDLWVSCPEKGLLATEEKVSNIFFLFSPRVDL